MDFTVENYALQSIFSANDLVNGGRPWSHKAVKAFFFRWVSNEKRLQLQDYAGKRSRNLWEYVSVHMYVCTGEIF